MDTSSFALVLGGGGVRGFAHIGVLKVLEEEGLRPGLIVGTSMGAVVGALYACGSSAQQLQTLVMEQDWLELFSYRRPPPLQLQGGWHGLPSTQITLLTRGFPPMPPPSLARGQRVESLLGSMTAGPLFRADNDFDRLPIPFRAVATDLNTGEMVVLSRGSLATAVRASGTVPLLLPPVEWEGRELVDGGFRANNPLEVARKMGFSRALVVDVSNVFVPGKKTPKNLMEMWVRAMELQQYEGNKVDPGEGEVVLHLPLEEFRSLEFDDAGAIIRIGYQQADAVRGRLRALMPKGGGSPDGPPGPAAKRQAPTQAALPALAQGGENHPTPGPVAMLRLQQLGCADAVGMSPAEICRRFRVRPGMQLPAGEFWRRLGPLARAPGVESAGIDLIPLRNPSQDTTGSPAPARVEMHLRLRKSPRWELAGHMITDDGAAILARLHQFRLPVGGGEAALSARYSHRTATAGLRLLQGWPPGGAVSFQLVADGSRDRPWVYRGGQVVDRWVIRSSKLSAELGWKLPAGDLQVRGGVLTGFFNSYLESRREPGSGDRSLGGLVAELSTGHDQGLVESRRCGIRLRALRTLPAWGDLDLWRLEGGATGEWKGPGRFRPQGALGAVFGSDGLPPELTGRAGGPLGWLGLRHEEIFASRLAWTRAGVAYELRPTLRLTAAAAVGWHDDRSLDRSAPLWGAGLGVRWLVPAGPFALYWTVAEHRPATLMVQLGPQF